MTKEELEKLIATRYESLPPKLKLAARHVLDAPRHVAMQSMRSVATQAGLQPLVMLRLARELGFDSYESFRALYVSWMSSSEMTFTGRAKALRRRRATEGKEPVLAQLYDAEVANLDRAFGEVNDAAFDAARKLLLGARRFYVLGLRGLFPAAYFLDYAARLFTDKSVLMAGVGGAIGDELRRANEKDVLVAFSFEPYAQLTVDAVRYARQRHVKIVAITDRVVSPIAEGSSVVLLAPNSGGTLYPSIMPAMAVAHALASLMVTAGGAATVGEIANSETQLKKLRAYVES